MNKRFSLSLGTIASLIIIYFIFLYASDHTGAGWIILAFIAKWYLIIVLGLILLSFIIVILISLIIFLFFLYAKFSSAKHTKPKKKINVFDAEYEVKENDRKPKMEI